MLSHEILRMNIFKNLCYYNKNLNVNVKQVTYNTIEENKFQTAMKFYKNKYEEMINVIKNLIEYLEKHDEPPKLLGIPMTTTTLLTFSAYAITLAGFIVSAL